jgi:hypothetical protein
MFVTKRIAGALTLLGLGWTVGYAQRSEPEFMLLIDAPAGETRIECVSGCRLIGARDLENPNADQMKAYSYFCEGINVKRCSARAGGWVVR